MVQHVSHSCWTSNDNLWGKAFRTQKCIWFSADVWTRRENSIKFCNSKSFPDKAKGKSAIITPLPPPPPPPVSLSIRSIYFHLFTVCSLTVLSNQLKFLPMMSFLKSEWDVIECLPFSSLQARKNVLAFENPLTMKSVKDALVSQGHMMTWPITTYPLLTADMIDMGKTIGHGNWGSIRHGVVSLNGKRKEVAVKQPKGKGHCGCVMKTAVRAKRWLIKETAGWYASWMLPALK